MSSTMGLHQSSLCFERGMLCSLHTALCSAKDFLPRQLPPSLQQQHWESDQPQLPAAAWRCELLLPQGRR